MSDKTPRTESAPPFPSVIEAAAALGLDRATLRSHLARSGHPTRVWQDGRAYLTVSLAEADTIVRSRSLSAGEARRAELPGISARQVADLLRIQRGTVYQLHRLGYLPAEWEGVVDGRRALRWYMAAVKAYAERQGRALVGEEDAGPPAPPVHGGVPLAPGAVEEARKSRDLISLPEAARMLGLTPFAIYALLGRHPGEIPTERVNRTIGIRLEDLPKLRDIVEASRIRRDRIKEGFTTDGRWLTSQGAAQRLGVSIRTVQRWTLEGRIKGEHMPGWRPAWRWDPDDLPAK